MKRLLILGCLCLAFQHLRGQSPPTTTNAAALPRPGYRFLFLIDTSSAMSRQKTVAIDTLSRLILSGVGGRIQSGDAWNLWTIDNQLHTDAIPPQRWDPQQRADVSNRIFRFLRDQRFNKKKAPLEKSLAAVAEEAEVSRALTVFLFTDGSTPMKGTPFDEQINQIFAKHAAGMRKGEKPFVTVFVVQDGRFAAHAVSPGGERIYIPRLPEAVATAKKSETPARTNSTVVSPTPAKTLTTVEISELLRQSQSRQTNTVAATPAPLIIRGGASQTNLAAVESPNKAAVETPVQTPLAAVPAPAATASPDRSAAVSKTPSSVAPPVQVRTEPSAPTGANASAPGDPIGPSTSQKDRPPVATMEPAADNPREALPRSPGPAQTAVLAQQEPLSNAAMYLMAAVALLLTALILAWLYIRSIRYVPRPSIISQSLDKEKK